MSIRIVVFGDTGVGKSTLTMQYAQGITVEHYDPLIEDYYRRLIEVESQQYMLEIQDTAEINGMKELYIKGGQGFVLIYSIISQSSLDNLSFYFEKIFKVKETYQVPMVLVGNKCDLSDQRIVTPEQGDTMAQKYGARFIEASSIKKINVENIFIELVKIILSSLPNEEKKSRSRCQLM